MCLTVLIFIGLDGFYGELAETGLFEQGLVVEHHIIPHFAVFEHALEVGDRMLVQSEHAVLVQSVVVLNCELHQRQ